MGRLKWQKRGETPAGSVKAASDPGQQSADKGTGQRPEGSGGEREAQTEADREAQGPGTWEEGDPPAGLEDTGGCGEQRHSPGY